MTTFTKRMQLGWWLVITAAALLAPAAHAAVTFVFQYDDLTNGLNKGFADTNIVPGTSQTYGQVRREATERAGRFLGALFVNCATCIVDVYSTAEPGNLGGCSSEPSGGNQAGFCRSVTAKKIIEGINETGSRPDMELSMNFVDPEDPNWNYSDAVGADEMDYVDTLIHEITHALGMLNTVGPGGGGLLESGPGQPEKWLVWDRFLTDQQTNPLINASTYIFNSSRMNTLTNNGLCFFGTNAVRACNGRLVQVYAPARWSEGSSACHVNTNFSSGTVMYFEGDPGPSSRYYCPVETGLLKDMGFDLNDPLAPTNIAASEGLYPGKIVVTWSAAPSTPAVSNPVAYMVYRNTSRDPDSAVLLADSLATNSLAYEDTTPAADTYYFYWVRAKYNYEVPQTTLFRDSGAGYAGEQPPAPPAPAASAASQGTCGDRIRVTWNAPAGATGFIVYRNTASNSALAAMLAPETAAPQFDDYSAAPGVLYYYWVKAKNAAGTSDFCRASSGYRAIHPPTDVGASKGTVGGKTRISWRGADGATAYEIWRGTSTFVTAAARIGATAATSYDDEAVAMGMTNYYWVLAKNTSYASQFSRPDHGFRKRTHASRGFDGDGVADPWLFLNGVMYFWTSANNYAMEAHYLGVQGAGLVADIDGDGYDDLAVVNGRTWVAWLSASDYQASQAEFSMAGEPALGDLDGDTKADPAVFSNGILTAWISDSNYEMEQAALGANGQLLLGDVDGDAKADPVLVENNVWTAWLSDAGYAAEQAVIGMGGTPLLGDFDGDGLADPVIRDSGNPAAGSTGSGQGWYFWLSGDEYRMDGPYFFAVP